MAPIDLSRDIIMGHEFCGEVLELGPDTAGPKPGQRVVSVPVVLSSSGLHQLAYNNEYPGGYSQYMLLAAPLVLEVPDGLDTRHAALTEPLGGGDARRRQVRHHRRVTPPSSWGAGRWAWPSSRRCGWPGWSRSWPLISHRPVGPWQLLMGAARGGRSRRSSR